VVVIVIQQIISSLKTEDEDRVTLSTMNKKIQRAIRFSHFPKVCYAISESLFGES